MCLVEVKPGPPKPQASCALPAADKQEIRTDSPMVRKAREGVMEFLLINHPLDCPICDQAGECKLQEFSAEYGRGYSRYVDEKNAKPKKTRLGPRARDVFLHGSLEEKTLLQHHANLHAKVHEIVFADVASINQNATCQRINQSGDHAGECTGGQSVEGQQGDAFALCDPQIKSIQDPATVFSFP